MSAPAWFKPTHTFEIDGHAWVGIGPFAFRAVDPIPDGLKPASGAGVKAEIVKAGPEAFPRSAPVKGYAKIGAAVFQAHFLDACESACHGITWHPGADGLSPAVGFVNGEPVAIVMPTRVDLEEEHLNPVGAPCEKCDGKGGTGKCLECDGEGEHECSCGHEHDCEECDGKGYDEHCPDCNGTGIVQATP